MTRPPAPRPDRPLPGLDARRVAADVIEGVLHHRPADETFEAHPLLRGLAERDRAFAKALVGATLRRLGGLRALVAAHLDRGPPKDAPRVEVVLLLGAAQLALLDVPAHAAVDLSVRLVGLDRKARHFTGLVNAVLRRIAADGKARLAGLDRGLDTPEWLMARWTAAYGADTARAICAAHAHEPALDLTVRADPAGWAERLGGLVLPTGSVRLLAKGPVGQLPGYAEGAWWVQDAAAALPARLLGDVRGSRVADLCAAPGGKTAQLAAAGADVLAVDRAEGRLARLAGNLARLKLTARTLAADVRDVAERDFDAVLLDAPCSATGTIRRHPDVAWTKTPADVAALAAVQDALLAAAVALVRPGGRLVYCTCSLEPEEGPARVARLLAANGRLARVPIAAADLGADPSWITPDGDLRTLPCHLPHAAPALAGLDGFYAARLAVA